MDPNRLICEKIGPDLASVPQPSYSTSYTAPPQSPRSFWKGRTGRAILWGTVSTVLSAIGLIGLALFEQYNSMLSELRTDLKHFHESSGEYVKKDHMLKMRDHLKESYKELTVSIAARDRLDAELKASERSREEMAKEIQHMRERLSFLEGMKASLPPTVGVNGAHSN